MSNTKHCQCKSSHNYFILAIGCGKAFLKGDVAQSKCYKNAQFLTENPDFPKGAEILWTGDHNLSTGAVKDWVNTQEVQRASS